jgi:Bacteriophage Lambda NinG protein
MALKRKRLKDPLKALHKKAWKLMSEYTRRRYADFNDFTHCFTCPTYVSWKLLQAGHFRHGYLDYDPFNLHPQCVSCNKFWHGRLDVYARNLLKKYGPKIIDQLDKKVTAERQRKDKLGYSHTKEELQEIIKDLTDKISQL